MNDLCLIKVSEDRGFLKAFVSAKKGNRMIGKSWVIGHERRL